MTTILWALFILVCGLILLDLLKHFFDLRKLRSMEKSLMELPLSARCAVRTLGEKGPMNCAELAKAMDIKRSNAWSHIRTAKAHGAVRVLEDGKSPRYEAAIKPKRDIAEHWVKILLECGRKS